MKKLILLLALMVFTVGQTKSPCPQSCETGNYWESGCYYTFTCVANSCVGPNLAWCFEPDNIDDMPPPDGPMLPEEAILYK